MKDGFIELTAIECFDYNEVMIDIIPDTGKIIDIYCYPDGIPETEDGKPIRTSKRENTHFRTISLNQFKKVSGLFIATVEESDHTFEMQKTMDELGVELIIESDRE